MRNARFTEHQIITVLKSVEAGHTVKDVCREAGISEASYYNWKAKFGGMEASDIKKMKDLEDENRRLKQMFADLSLECRALKDVIEKKALKPAIKRELVSYLTAQFAKSIRQASRTLSLSRTVYVYQPDTRRDEPVIQLLTELAELAERYPRYGFKKLFQLLRRQGNTWNRKHVHRIYCLLKLLMDNGPELVSLTLAQWAEEHSVALEFIKPGKPTQNAFIEQFNRKYRTEILDFYLFRTLNETRDITESWLNEYNRERPHESLNNLTPEEYRLMAEKPGLSKSAWN